MIDAHEVTACLVTRGDVDLQEILDSLIFSNVVVWDNSIWPDWKVAGRYMAALQSRTYWVYWQDDDTIVPESTQRELLKEFDPNYDILANWGHGENPDGYDDLPLVCGGAIADWRAAWHCIARYGAEHELDDGFKYEADFVVGALYENWEHIHLPFEIRDVAYNGRRLADQPWQRALKYAVTSAARRIRDRDAAYQKGALA